MLNLMTIGLAFVSSCVTLITLYLFFEESFDRFVIKLQGGIPRGFIIFITGTNGVGKTTIANRLAKKIGIESVIEINDLREALRSREDIFINANKTDEYELLKASSYLSDGIEVDDNGHLLIGYEGQCEIMTRTILSLVKRKQKNNHSAIFEGINIMPSHLVKADIQSRYILFVYLNVTPEKLLQKRLDMKTTDILKRGEYESKLKEIIKISNIIEADFKQVIEMPHRTKIHTISLNNSCSRSKTTRQIVRKVRSILKVDKTIHHPTQWPDAFIYSNAP